MIETLSSLDYDSIGGNVLAWLGRALAYGTLLAAATWLVCRLLPRRIGVVLQGALWVIVLVKFMMPAGPGFSHSLASLGETLKSRLVAAQSVPVEAASTPAGSTEPELLFALVDVGAGPVQNPVAANAGGTSIPWLGIIAGTYLFGVALIGAVRLNAYRRFARACRALTPAPREARVVVEDVCRRLGVHPAPEVRLSEHAPAPFILGAVRPILVLSRRQLVRPDELEAVVLHEIAHLRRGDLFVRYIQWIAGTLLFFWPVVAWVNRRVDLVREHACDDWALRHGRLAAGDYARCLLRAMHPAPLGRAAYVPAAMARNVKSVERRIEMIMESTNRRASLRSLGVPATGVLAVWCLFVLTGAAAPQGAPAGGAAKGDEAPPATDAKRVIVVKKVGEDGQPIVVKTEGEGAVAVGGKFVPAEGGQHVFMARRVAGPEGAKMFNLKINEDFAAFMKEHPTADANADGKVSREERDAFLVARAMSQPSSVLEKYPASDRNKDGSLDANEAARLLVQGGMHMRTFKHGPGEASAQGMIVHEKAKMGVVRMRTKTDAQPPEGMRTEANGEPAKAGPARVRIAGPAAGAWTLDGSSIGKWVLENIKVEPTTADVLRYLPAVKEAPDAMFLEVHPEADTNKDGKLTEQEREAFHQNLMADVRAKMLKANPKADTNGDGVLSEEEFINFHHEGDVFVPAEGAIMIGGPVNGETPEVIELQEGGGEIHIEVQAETNGGNGIIQLKPVITKTDNGDGEIEIQIEPVEEGDDGENP